MVENIIRLVTCNSSTWQYPVLSILSTPPSPLVEGARYLIGASPTGAWASYTKYIVTCQNGSWVYTSPKEGMYVYDLNINNLWKYVDTNEWIPAMTYTGTVEPTYKVEGSLWYSTTDMLLYIYNGSKWISVSRRIISFVRGGVSVGNADTYLRCDSNVSGSTVGYYLPYNGVLLSYYGQISTGLNTRSFRLNYYSDASTSTYLDISLPGALSITNSLDLNIQKDKLLNMYVKAGTATPADDVSDAFFEFEVAWRPSNV